MTTIFEQGTKPPSAREYFTESSKGTEPPASLTLESLSFLNSLWSWVASGYVIIPCDVGGSVNAIELTPKFWPRVGGSGYAHLLGFSFVAAGTSTGATTIQVIGADSAALDALPAYAADAVAGAGDFVAGVPYVAFFCDAVASLSLPDRMVRK